MSSLSWVVCLLCLYIAVATAYDKRSMSTSCRRCTMRPSDWWSCATCYRSKNTGFIPYYGKRSSNNVVPDDLADDIRADLYDLIDKRASELDKRSSLGACRCCLSYANSRCCSRCHHTVYTKRDDTEQFINDDIYDTEDDSLLEEKRGGYNSYNSGYGYVAHTNCRSCCRRSTFDFSCCLGCF